MAQKDGRSKTMETKLYLIYSYSGHIHDRLLSYVGGVTCIVAAERHWIMNFIDTVAFHLSVLKDRFPNGINVLSLFSGIGGAEIALYRLGIPMKNVVSVEISEVSRNVVRCWREQTNQRGNLYHLADVQELNADHLEHYISSFGGFDLMIGGSPCNNLAGSNRHHRDGLQDVSSETGTYGDFLTVGSGVDNS